jgi:hypothetical protein
LLEVLVGVGLIEGFHGGEPSIAIGKSQ